MGTQGGWEEAEERGTVEEREEKRNTGSNRVSLVFQHPPPAMLVECAFAKGEKRSNRYTVFVLSDVKRIGRDKTRGEGWNQPFHPFRSSSPHSALQFLRNDLCFPPFHRRLSIVLPPRYP